MEKFEQLGRAKHERLVGCKMCHRNFQPSREFPKAIVCPSCFESGLNMINHIRGLCQGCGKLLISRSPNVKFHQRCYRLRGPPFG